MRERTIDKNGIPVQQSMTIRPADYIGMNISRPMLGVVLDVYAADNERNRSSYQREDRRGYLHACTVLIIQDGRATHLPLENVLIPPDHCSGLDDYCERLPRACTALVTGENWNSQLNHINPYDLDGDWCIVSFLGGSIDQPYVSNWWPHPHNTFDPATSGTTNPNATGQGETLLQSKRMFRRVNGVECTVTGAGNVYISTHRASSTLNYGTDLSPVDGRFPRTLNADVGGSFKMWVKASQSLELDWNAPEDGMGALDVSDDEIPQTNPSESGTASRTTKANTYILVEKDRIDITVPDQFKLLSKKRLLLESQEETTLTVGSDFTANVSGDGSLTTDGSLDISATGAATIDSQSTLSLSGSSVSVATSGSSAGALSSLSVSPSGVTLGSGALGGVVGGTGLQAALTAFAAAVATAQASASVETAYATAMTAAANALVAAIAAAISPTTKVG